MANIAIVTQFFPPKSSATGQLMADLSEGLSERGHKIVLIKNTRLKGSRKGTNATEYRFGNSIAIKGLGGIWFTLEALLKLFWHASDYDMAFIASNPPYICVAGVLARLLLRKKVVFIYQDMFPDSLVLTGALSSNASVARLLRAWMKICLRLQNLIVVLDQDKVKYLISIGISRDKICVINNWAVQTDAQKALPTSEVAREIRARNGFSILYSGNFGRMHDIETIIGAARELRYDGFNFVFIGDGYWRDRLLQESLEMDSNIFLYPYQPQSDLSETLASCDLGVVSLIDGAERIVSPSKLYGLLKAGRYILLIANRDSYLAELIERSSCGIVVTPHAKRELKETLLKLRDMPGEIWRGMLCSRELYSSSFSKDQAIHKYAIIVDKLMST